MTQHSMPMKESAGYLRFPCTGVAVIRVLALEAKMEEALVNLSVSGCCIDTKTPFPPIENPYVDVTLCVD